MKAHVLLGMIIVSITLSACGASQELKTTNESLVAQVESLSAANESMSDEIEGLNKTNHNIKID